MAISSWWANLTVGYWLGAIESWNSHPEGITFPTVFSSGSWITPAEAVWFRLLEGVSWLCHWKIGPYMDNIKSGNGLQGIICLYKAWIFASMSAFWDVIALYQAYMIYMCYNNGAQHRYGMGSIMDTTPTSWYPRISAETTNISSDTWWNHHSTVWIKHLLTFGASHLRMLLMCWWTADWSLDVAHIHFHKWDWRKTEAMPTPIFSWKYGYIMQTNACICLHAFIYVGICIHICMIHILILHVYIYLLCAYDAH